MRLDKNLQMSVTVTLGNRTAREQTFHQNQPIRIGRAPENDILLDDAAVSRSHAEMVWLDEVCQIEDLDSENGTWLNGSKIRSRQVRDGDVVQIGQYRLHVRIRRTSPADRGRSPYLEPWREERTLRAP